MKRGSPRQDRITTSPPIACLGHHYAMQNTLGKKRSPERGLISRGHAGSRHSGIMLKARIIMRCVDKGNTARILAGCDIGATPETIRISGHRPKPTQRRKFPLKFAPSHNAATSSRSACTCLQREYGGIALCAIALAFLEERARIFQDQLKDTAYARFERMGQYLKASMRCAGLRSKGDARND